MEEAKSSFVRTIAMSDTLSRAIATIVGLGATNVHLAIGNTNKENPGLALLAKTERGFIQAFVNVGENYDRMIKLADSSISELDDLIGFDNTQPGVPVEITLDDDLDTITWSLHDESGDLIDGVSFPFYPSELRQSDLWPIPPRHHLVETRALFDIASSLSTVAHYAKEEIVQVSSNRGVISFNLPTPYGYVSLSTPSIGAYDWWTRINVHDLSQAVDYLDLEEDTCHFVGGQMEHILVTDGVIAITIAADRGDDAFVIDTDILEENAA